LDVAKARHALHQAELEIPPTVARAARKRLTHAAGALGVDVLTRQLSPREAIAMVGVDRPLALFAVTPSGTARWHVLVERRRGEARLVNLAGSGSDAWLDAAALAKHVGGVDADAVLEWLVAQPSAPADVHDEETLDDHHSPASHGPTPFRRLLHLLRPESRDLWMVVIYAIAVGVLSLAVPVTAMAVVNSTALATLVQQLVVLCLALLAALTLAAILHILQTIVVEYLQRRVFVRVAADLAYRLPRVDMRAFDRQHGPELVNRFFDVLTVQKAGATLLMDGITVGLQIAVGLTLLAFYHQLLLGFDLILIAGLLAIVFVLGRGAVASAIRESRSKYGVAGWMEEIARHPAAFKFNGGPRFAQDRVDALAQQYLQARQAHFHILLRQVAFSLGLQALASTALLGVGGYLVIAGQLTLGQLVAAEIVVALVVASFAKLGKHLESFYDLLAAMDKLGHLLDLPLERQDGAVHHERSDGAVVRVRNVSFSYDGGKRPVLAQVNLDVSAGERVAIVGPNGAGKSTLVDLLFGLRNPTTGHIEIDGTDVREIRLESLRDHVAVVKGIEVFEGSIIDNVRTGRVELSLADVRRALRLVGLLEDVLDLPEGVLTRVYAGGLPLSLGQAERLMLARAIAGSPRLLVLDEVLDDMDQQVRHEVLPAVLGRDARWTLLVITHSQEVAKLCDRQVNLENTRRSRGAAQNDSCVSEKEVRTRDSRGPDPFIG
jgi:ABC-type bacteriocin/lantibiotic exporter with double-glycine peptidase domain